MTLTVPNRLNTQDTGLQSVISNGFLINWIYNSQISGNDVILNLPCSFTVIGRTYKTMNQHSTSTTALTLRQSLCYTTLTTIKTQQYNGNIYEYLSIGY